jgi:hypothetical protein
MISTPSRGEYIEAVFDKEEAALLACAELEYDLPPSCNIHVEPFKVEGTEE